MPTDLQLKRPIDGITLEIIRAVHSTAATLGHRALLVGATARIILIENVFGLPTGRATKDVDFAFAIETWEQFEALRQHLIDKHEFEADARVHYKLYYHPKGGTYGVPLDLVPFGALSGEREEIRWPPEMKVIMNVAGFADALESAVRVEVVQDVIIAIASLPAIAVLKVFSWLDRGKETPKDAFDLTALLLLYHEIDQERIFTIPEDVFAGVGYEIELGGAWLLGQDARRLTLPATSEKMITIFSSAAQTERLINDMARALRVKADPEKYAARLLEQFKEGFGYT